jgi:hypothetical protein
MQRLLRHVIFVPVRPGSQTTKSPPRINRGELIFFKPYDVTFRISGGQLHFLLRFHRLADDAPYFIGCGAAMNESARAEA